MVKYILIAGVFFTCTIIGYLFGEVYRKRPLDLKECYKGITLLQNQVLFNNTPLPEALDIISNKVKSPFKELLKEVSKELYDGENFSVYDCFKENYLEHKDEYYFKDEDIKLLSDFLISLGDSGIYGQDKVFKLTLEGLKDVIKDADILAKKNTKMYRYLGIWCGALISSILI